MTNSIHNSLLQTSSTYLRSGNDQHTGASVSFASGHLHSDDSSEIIKHTSIETSTVLTHPTKKEGCCGWSTKSKSDTYEDAEQVLSSTTYREESRGFCGGKTPSYQLRVAGPSMSGKTTFLRYLKHGQFVETVPTKDMEVSRVLWNGTPFIVWDSRKYNDGGDLKPAIPTTPNIIDDLSRGSLILNNQPLDALVYVVDASDPGRLKIAGRDFDRLLKRYRKIPVVLIIGAKRDQPSSIGHNEIRTHLRLLETAYDRECAICLISSLTGEGIDQAMEWVYNKVRRREGFWASLFRRLPKQNKTHFSIFGSEIWDPFYCCRYSRLESI